MISHPTSFKLDDKLIELKSKQGSQKYLQAQWRLAWYRDNNDQGKITILKSVIEMDREVEAELFEWNNDKKRSEKVKKQAKGWAYFEVRVEDDRGGIAEASGSESAVDFPDFIEKAWTKAVSRCLGALGYGTQYTGDEFDEKHRITDSPVDSALLSSQSTPAAQPTNEKREAPSSSSSKASAPVTKPTPVPVPTEPKKVKLATSEQIAEISDAAHILGPFEWRHLLPVSRLPEDTSQWSFDQATMFLKRVSDWAGSDTQKAWLVGKASKEQMDEITRFRSKEQYGGNAVASLKSRIESLKDVSSTDFTHEQADMLLNYLYTAKATIEQAKRVDPANNVVADFKGITHPLDFYAVTRKPEEGTLEDYLKQLNEIEAKQAA